MVEGSESPTPASPPPPAPVYVAAPAPRRSFGLLAGLGVLMFGAFMGSTCSNCIQMVGNREGPFARSGPRVGVVEVMGAISDAREVTEALAAFADNDDIEAVVLRVDSPGGSVGPSQEIYEAVRRTAATKPVVASMGAMAASGGFWVSLAADEIFANPGSITGSIGVIVQIPDFTGLAELARFDMRIYKSGPQKDLGNPLRPEDPADAAVFQTLVDDVYAQFVELTAERRGLDVETVKTVADGRILTGRDAMAKGLVDGMGGLETAARRALALSEKTGTSTSTFSEEAPILVYPPEDAPPLLQLLGASVADGVSRGVAAGVESGVRATSEARVDLR